MSENAHARDIVALQKEVARDEGTTDDVIVSSRGDAWHEPADAATADEPKPDCRAQAVEESNWSWMSRDDAEVWRDECSYCNGSFDQTAGGRAILPTDTEVSGDD